MTITSILRSVLVALYRLSLVGLSRGPHVTRYSMYSRLARSAEPRAADLRALSISHSEPLAKLLGFADHQITDASYPECNILRLPFVNGLFDAVLSDQVLEHVEGDPQAAVDEVYRVLKPGGLCLHTTCFINPIHGAPNDYWRFTPEALRLLCGRQGEILELGGWGNPCVWVFAAMGLRQQPIPHARWHPAHWLATINHDAWPIVTWVLARKHGGERRGAERPS